MTRQHPFRPSELPSFVTLVGLATFALSSFSAEAIARVPDWTLFPVPPCAIADLRVAEGREEIRLRARGARADLSKQGGAPDGCNVPANAHALLVDVLIDARRDVALSASVPSRREPARRTLAAVRSGFTAQRSVLELCRGPRCPHDVTLQGLAPGDRLRVFVRGYLMEGQVYASPDLLEDLLDRDRMRVIDCRGITGPGGRIARVGADCGLDYDPVPRGDVGGDGDPSGGDGPELTGCPYAYFDESEWFAEPTRFRFPVEEPQEIAPTIIHMDHDRTKALNDLACAPWYPGLLCYDNHEGTDFSLLGLFYKQDDGSVHAVAAADGVVMATREDRFDRCQADLEPFDCSEQTCETIAGFTVCSVCPVNPNFGQPFCQEGDEPKAYDELQANYVELCHADGTITRYLHLMRDEVLVEPGDAVQCGQRLGLIGSSGRSSAPHLHFDVQRVDVDGWIDPFDAGSGESLWLAPAFPGLLPGPECQ
jgi:hypothetical protein